MVSNSTNYKKPSLDLLEDQVDTSKFSEKEMNDLVGKINEVLESFKVNAKAISTRKSALNIIIDISSESGTRLSEIENLKNEFEIAARAPVKVFSRGKLNMVHISVLLGEKSLIRLKSVLKLPEFKYSESFLPIAAGMDEDGKPCIINLDEAPHMLITGSTGTGKTVFVDDIILSLIYRRSPTLRCMRIFLT